MVSGLIPYLMGLNVKRSLLVVVSCGILHFNIIFGGRKGHRERKRKQNQFMSTVSRY